MSRDPQRKPYPRNFVVGELDVLTSAGSGSINLDNAAFLMGSTTGGSDTQLLGVTGSDVVLMGDVSGNGLNTQIEADGTVGLDIQTTGDVNFDNGSLRVNSDGNKVTWGADQDGSVVFDSSADELQVVDEDAAQDVLQIPMDGSGAVNVANRDFTIQGTTSARAPGTTSAATPGFGSWTQISADRPGFLVVDASAETDATDAGTIVVDVDESGGTTADYTLNIVNVQADLPAGTNRSSGNGMIYVPAGGQYQIRNVSDPNNANSLDVVREGTW